MNPLRRRRLHLEQLETRDCPSLTLSLYSGSLTISGTPNAALLVKETAPSTLTVTDGTSTKGTFHVTGNLSLNLTSHPNTVDVDVNGNRFGGNVSINLGNGDTTGLSHPVDVYSSQAGGSVGGSVSFQGGSGKETLNIGLPALANAGAVGIGGTVSATGKVSGGGNFGPGDFLFVGPGGTVGGDVTTSQIDNVDIGEPGLPLTTVGGNVSINDANSGAALSVHISGNVGRNVSVTGTNFDDVFTLQQAGTGVGGQVTGTLSVNLGAGTSQFGDLFTLAAGTTVGGSTTLSGQGNTAPDSYNVAGAVNGDLTLNMGDGDNSLAFSAGATVAGNMRVNGGNGNNDLATSSFDGTVTGNLTFTFGNGNNQVVIGNAPGGLLSWTSGNGNDSVTFGDAASVGGQTWNVHMQFGTANDTLTLADSTTTAPGITPATPDFLTGFVDVGGPPGGNSFDPTNSLGTGSWVIVQPFTIQNV